jgi:hypothetical protein
MSKPQPKPGATAFPAFRLGRSIDDEDEVELGDIIAGGAAATVALPTKPVADLSQLTPVWFLIGAGWSGKTTLARWLGDPLTGAGRKGLLAALDPQNRTLAAFFNDGEQPPSNDPAQTARWLRDLVGFLIEQRVPAVLDMGGGDTALASLLTLAPGFAGAMEEAGVAPVAAFLLGPRVDDLAVLQSLRGRGFRPKATAIVLNEGRVDQGLTREEAFARVLRHSAFRAAVDDGAAVIWMPRLDPPDLAQEIEAKRLHFTDARDGIVPQGRNVAPVTALERVMVRAWLERMDRAFAPVRTWLPWAS